MTREAAGRVRGVTQAHLGRSLSIVVPCMDFRGMRGPACVVQSGTEFALQPFLQIPLGRSSETESQGRVGS